MPLAAIAAALLFAGCATDKYGPFEPKVYKDAPEFQGAVPRDYSGGMGHHNGYDKAYEWQQANPKLVASSSSIIAFSAPAMDASSFK